MRRVFWLLLVVLAFFSLHIRTGFAKEDPGFPFAVQIIPPDDQLSRVSYYHVPGYPGAALTLQAKLINLTDQPLEVKAVPMNAYSAPDGIFYKSAGDAGPQTYALTDEAYGLAQYMTVAPQIMLAPGQSETVSICIAVPNIDTGVLLGSIRFVVFAGTHGMAADGRSAGVLIDKHQAIDTAILIDLPRPAAPSVAVGDARFGGESINISLELINRAALIQNNISGAYQISDSADAVLFGGEMKRFKMSPMSSFMYPIPWDHAALEEGAYTVSLELNVDGDVQHITRPLIIGDEAVSLLTENGILTQNTAVKADSLAQNAVLAELAVWLPIIAVIALLVREITRRSGKAKRKEARRDLIDVSRKEADRRRMETRRGLTDKSHSRKEADRRRMEAKLGRIDENRRRIEAKLSRAESSRGPAEPPGPPAQEYRSRRR